MSRPLLWLQIAKAPNCYAINEYGDTFLEDHQSTRAQKLSLITFVGTKIKSRFLRNLTNKKHRGAPGGIYLWQQPRTDSHVSPLLYIDLDIQPSLPCEITKSLRLDDLRDHRIHECAHGIPHLYNIHRFYSLLCSRVIAPISNVVCFFAIDLGGMEGIADLLADQAIQQTSHADSYRPQILIVVHTDSDKFSEVAFLNKLTDKIVSILMQVKNQSSGTAVRQALRRELGPIHILSLPKHGSKEEQNVADLYSRLVSINNQADVTRFEKRFDFTVSHIQAFSTLLLHHYCTYNNQPFSFIKRSRAPGFSSETVYTHIQDLLYLVPNPSWTDHLVVPLLGSALLFMHYPPGSPGKKNVCSFLDLANHGTIHMFIVFDPLGVFDLYYATILRSIDTSLTVQPANRSDLCEKIRESFVANYAKLSAESLASSTTAREVHLQNLKALQPYLANIVSNRTCLCCMHKAPEKVLSCGHAFCDTCLRAVGRRSAQERHTFRIPVCVLCGVSNHRVNVRLMPPTASVRLLSIDGGGIRGIIPLVYLEYLEKALKVFQCPIADFFDFACGTSAGGLIIVGLFVCHWAASEGLQRFKNMATKVFGTRNVNTMMVLRIHELILSCWRDSRYDTSSMKNIFGDGLESYLQMFNPLNSDTKLAITTTDVKSVHPCLLTNYNGLDRDPELGYTVLRARLAADDPTVNDAICSTSAAPWYFKPWTIKKFGTFQDGGLQYNNPLPLALSEMRHLWPDRPIPDLVLSIGTGTKIDGCAAETKQVNDRFITRLIRAFWKNMDGEKSWREFYNTLSETMKRRSHRLNLRLDVNESAMDDHGAMEALEAKVANQMCMSNLQGISDSLIASSFYFELERLPTYKDGKVHCQGHIFCRLPLDVAGRRNLYKELLECKAYFLIQGCPIRCVEVLPKSNPLFKKSARFTLKNASDIVGISILGITSSTRPISGFPRPLEDLISMQNLKCPFGRLDYAIDGKPLPSIPEKRKYQAYPTYL